MKKSFNIEYEECHLNELSAHEQKMVNMARKISESAYAPYSKFLVGAVVELDNGELVSGSNQENVAYPSGLCAERVALFYAGANFPNNKVKKIVIVAKGDLIAASAILSPCGGCRQVMAETESRQNEAYEVILVNQEDIVTKFDSAKHLLPLTFGE